MIFIIRIDCRRILKHNLDTKAKDRARERERVREKDICLTVKHWGTLWISNYVSRDLCAPQ